MRIASADDVALLELLTVEVALAGSASLAHAPSRPVARSDEKVTVAASIGGAAAEVISPSTGSG